MHENEQYREAIDVLRNGGIVAVPTDTVYGLLAVASDAVAVERIYAVKRRDPAQPMPLFVVDLAQAELIAEVNDAARALANRWWPGALTLVLRRKSSYETRAAAGGATVGVRAPGDDLLRELAAELGPLTGTSANIAGRQECHTADEVRGQLGDNLDFVVEAQVAASRVPSTIVDVSVEGEARIVRDGAIDRQAIDDALAGIATLG